MKKPLIVITILMILGTIATVPALADQSQFSDGNVRLGLTYESRSMPMTEARQEYIVDISATLEGKALREARVVKVVIENKLDERTTTLSATATEVDGVWTADYPRGQGLVTAITTGIVYPSHGSPRTAIQTIKVIADDVVVATFSAVL